MHDIRFDQPIAKSRSASSSASQGWGEPGSKRGPNKGSLVAIGLLAMLSVAGFVYARVELSAAPGNSAVAAVTKATKAATAASVVIPAVNAHSPESRLIAAYQQLAQGNETQALDLAQQLVHDQPDFALAQLLYADLLAARSGRMTPLGSTEPTDASGPLAPEARTRLAALQLESRLRLAAIAERPPANSVPQAFLKFHPSVKHAIAVDTAKARLYLFANTPEGMVLVRDSYVTIGKQGTGKSVEGDQRTPLGAYFIGSPRDEPPARYGAAALPLNYPNEYDRLVGRGGTNIWLHGEPAGNFARPPLSTDGCVVLTNDQMQQLAAEVEPRSTPVLIGKNLQWVSRDQAKTTPAELTATFGAWQQARAAHDADRLARFYAAGLTRGSDSAEDRLTQKLNQIKRRAGSLGPVEVLSAVTWQDEQPLMIVTYQEAAEANSPPKTKRQYWRQHQGQWQIIFDGLIG